jgi:uncharacterized protein (TIGR02145 family)
MKFIRFRYPEKMKILIRNSVVVLFFISISLFHSCKKEKVPTLTTSAITNITGTTASSGGTITSEGSSKVTVRGICWNTGTTPTIADNLTSDSAGSGSFTSHLTGLKGSTTYNVRAYATNSVGTAYGNELTFSTLETVADIDGNVYNTISIGTQVWMAENLKTTRFRNGVLIGTTTPATLKISLGSYQWAYDGNESNVETYGRLYTGYAITDSRNVCPTGWHVPSDAEWTTLTSYLISNGYGYEGSGDDIAKSMAATSGWKPYGNVDVGEVGNDQASNNSSGFSAVPGGYRGMYYSNFFEIGNRAVWWSSNGSSNRSIHFYLSNVVSGGGNGADAFSVRCLKD